MPIVFEDHSDWVKRGKLVTFQMAMDPIPDGRMRTIRVWTPESYDGVKRFPVLYLHDGQVVFPEKANPAMGSWDCDERISELEPECQCIVAAIDTSDDRSNELLPPLKPDLNFGAPRRGQERKVNPLGGYYADFVRDTLKPTIDRCFMTLPDAAHTAVGGASMGGLESLYMTFKDPEVFGRSLDLSCGLGLLEAEDYLKRVDAYDAKKLENVRFYLYTGDQGIEVLVFDYLIPLYRHMKDSLKLSNRQLCLIVDSRESHWGTSWSKCLQEGLRFLFREDNGVETPNFGMPRPRENGK